MKKPMILILTITSFQKYLDEYALDLVKNHVDMVWMRMVIQYQYVFQKEPQENTNITKILNSKIDNQEHVNIY